MVETLQRVPDGDALCPRAPSGLYATSRNAGYGFAVAVAAWTFGEGAGGISTAGKSGAESTGVAR